MTKKRLKWLAVPLICMLVAVFAFGMAGLPQASAAGEATVVRSIDPDSIAPGGTTEISVTITTAETLNGFILDEDPPSGWTVEAVENAGATFKESEVKWLWTESLAAGESKTVIYNVTAPEDAADGIISGVLKSSGIADIAVTGENTVTVTGVAPEQIELESSGSLAKAAFATSNLSISPSEVDIGETVTISVLVRNTGDASGSYQVTLKIDGKVEATREVTLDAGAATYSVDINGLTGSFNVREKPTLAPSPPQEVLPEVVPPPVKPINWPVVGGVIAGVVIVGLLIFFLAGRRAI